MTTGAKKRSPVLAIVLVVALCAACVPCIGVLAGIAIPSFVSYVRRSKAVEAGANVRAIARGVSAAYDDGAAAGTPTLPPSLPRTPATASAERRAWPPDAAPGWAAIGFTPMDPLYYSYEYLRNEDGRGFVVRAYGDLDGDGVESLYEVTGGIDASTGELRVGEVYVEDELE